MWQLTICSPAGCQDMHHVLASKIPSSFKFNQQIHFPDMSLYINVNWTSTWLTAITLSLNWSIYCWLFLKRTLQEMRWYAECNQWELAMLQAHLETTGGPPRIRMCVCVCEKNTSKLLNYFTLNLRSTTESRFRDALQWNHELPWAAIIWCIRHNCSKISIENPPAAVTSSDKHDWCHISASLHVVFVFFCSSVNSYLV